MVVKSLAAALCFFVTASSAFSPSSCSRNHHHPTSFCLAGADTITNQNNHDVIQTIIQQNQDEEKESSAFEILTQKAIHTLLKSDSDTDENEHAYGSASQGLWINSKAAKEMQDVLDRIVVHVSFCCVLIKLFLYFEIFDLVGCIFVQMKICACDVLNS